MSGTRSGSDQFLDKERVAARPLRQVLDEILGRLRSEQALELRAKLNGPEGREDEVVDMGGRAPSLG